ncbi:MAG: LPS export ABC transporter periplasmic protein LptC, partial [Wenzhouxiangella sp.]|nr:LPS export ABC transporter periplasmic protein LptC [Wenzhouxiangella sp.]
MSWRLILAACFALALVFALRWMLPSDRTPGALPELPDARFDYILSDFSARFTDESGQVALLVSGPRLEHDSATRVATLTEPRFHVEPDGSNWRGQARQARFDRNGEILVLEGDVQLTQAHEDGAVVVTGEALQHDRLARTIASDQAVEIERPGTWLRAGGLMIRLDQDFIELSDHVQATIQVDNDRPSADRSRADDRDP